MQFINKTGLVLIGAAFLSAPVFVGCDDDTDGTEIGGGSGGSAGTAGTAGSAGSGGEAGSSGAGGDGGTGGTSGSGGSGGTGGSAGDPDAGDGGVNPLLAFAEAVCTTWGELANASDAGVDGGGGLTCTTPESCVDSFLTAPPGCESEFTAYLTCMSTQPASASECFDAETPQFRLCSEPVRTAFGGLPDCGPNTHGCLDEECAFQACVTAGLLDVQCD
jgi:hypothetical protein